jgi:predicted nucleotidyltransferase
MYQFKHHEESVGIMVSHYRANKEVAALFLIGSVATNTARPDSDIDAVAVVSDEYHLHKKANGGLEECIHGKCTYDGGYFNIHYMTMNDLERIAENGSEPMRNMFVSARELYCDISGLPTLIASIPVFQPRESAGKQFKFYCTFKMFHSYFWKCCNPEGFMRAHISTGMVYNLYRLILIENKILFPSARKLEETVILASNKPPRIVEKCRRFMQTLTDDDCAELINSYEQWTAYDFPKEHSVVMNNFANPYDWS